MLRPFANCELKPLKTGLKSLTGIKKLTAPVTCVCNKYESVCVLPMCVCVCWSAWVWVFVGLFGVALAVNYATSAWHTHKRGRRLWVSKPSNHRPPPTRPPFSPPNHRPSKPPKSPKIPEHHQPPSLEKPLLTYSLGSFYCLQAAASAFAAAAPKMLQHNSQHVEQFSHEAESSGRRAPFPKTCARASDRIQF